MPTNHDRIVRDLESDPRRIIQIYHWVLSVSRRQFAPFVKDPRRNRIADMNPALEVLATWARHLGLAAEPLDVLPDAVAHYGELRRFENQADALHRAHDDAIEVLKAIRDDAHERISESDLDDLRPLCAFDEKVDHALHCAERTQELRERARTGKGLAAPLPGLPERSLNPESVLREADDYAAEERNILADARLVFEQLGHKPPPLDPEWFAEDAADAAPSVCPAPPRLLPSPANRERVSAH